MTEIPRCSLHWFILFYRVQLKRLFVHLDGQKSSTGFLIRCVLSFMPRPPEAVCLMDPIASIAYKLGSRNHYRPWNAAHVGGSPCFRTEHLLCIALVKKSETIDVWTLIMHYCNLYYFHIPGPLGPNESLFYKTIIT